MAAADLQNGYRLRGIILLWAKNQVRDMWLDWHLALSIAMIVLIDGLQAAI